MPTRGGSRRAARRSALTIEPRAPRQATVLAPVEIPDLPYSEPLHQYWLVQRLELRHYPGDREGFDRLFQPEYMGNSYFEFNEVPKALRRIREAGDLIVRQVEITFKGITKPVYFVGPRVGIEKKLADFGRWLAIRGKRSEEWTNFDELFTEDYFLGHIPGTIAWWSLEDDIAWALDPEIAQKLLEGFTPARDLAQSQA